MKPETENTATIAKKDSLAESTTIVENNKSSEEGAPQLQHMHENLESSKDQVESNVKLDSENIFSGEKLDENHVKLETKQGDNYSLLDENSQENEQSNARRISLFDTAKEENEVSEPENIQKKEPYLNYSSQETNEKIDLNNEFNQDNLEQTMENFRFFNSSKNIGSGFGYNHNCKLTVNIYINRNFFSTTSRTWIAF